MIIGNGLFLRTTSTVPPPPVGDGSIPTLVASGSTFSGGTSALSLTGGTYQAYDVGIAVVHSNFTAPTASGWTQIGTIDSTTTFNCTISLYYKRALSASDLSGTWSDVGNQGGKILVFRGCKTSGSPIDVSNFTKDDTNHTALSIAGVTTTGANRLILQAYAEGADSATAPTSVALANAALSGVTEVINNGYVQGSGGGLGAMIGGLAVAGATGAATGTATNNVNTTHATIALLPNP